MLTFRNDKKLVFNRIKKKKKSRMIDSLRGTPVTFLAICMYE